MGSSKEVTCGYRADAACQAAIIWVSEGFLASTCSTSASTDNSAAPVSGLSVPGKADAPGIAPESLLVVADVGEQGLAGGAAAIEGSTANRIVQPAKSPVIKKAEQTFAGNGMLEPGRLSSAPTRPGIAPRSHRHLLASDLS